MFKHNPLMISSTVVLLIALLAACQPQQSENVKDNTRVKELSAGVVKHNSDLAYAIYSDSLMLAEVLHDDILLLIDSPSKKTLHNARQSWIAAREPYGQSEVYRFRGGPIDALKADGSMGEDGEGPEGRINAWPLGEALIDYVATNIDGNAGPENPANTIQGNLIANVQDYPQINREVINQFYEYGEDERNVTTGYHAIEFLLWGQDVNSDSKGGFSRDSTPGQRPYTDYLAIEGQCTSGAIKVDAQICERRGDYLIAASEMLIDDLAPIVAAWQPQTGEHYKTLVQNPSDSLAGMLESMGRLSFGELAGERINISLATDSQEDEHSCFSDNTHRDIFLNAKGIENTYLGTYQKIDGTMLKGPSIDSLLREIGQVSLADELTKRLDSTMQAASQIDAQAKNGKPFDVLIQEGVQQSDISAMIERLVKQTDSIEKAIDALAVSTQSLRQDTEQKIGE